MKITSMFSIALAGFSICFAAAAFAKVENIQAPKDAVIKFNLKGGDTQFVALDDLDATRKYKLDCLVEKKSTDQQLKVAETSSTYAVKTGDRLISFDHLVPTGDRKSIFYTLSLVNTKDSDYADGFCLLTKET